MTPIHQDPQAWNSFQCALASLLDLPLDDVPSFLKAEDDPAIDMAAWSRWRDEHGIGAITFNASHEAAVDWPYLAYGYSPRGRWGHWAVHQAGQLLHDPHPSGDGIAKVVDMLLLLPRDAARSIARTPVQEEPNG